MKNQTKSATRWMFFCSYLLLILIIWIAFIDDSHALISHNQHLLSSRIKIKKNQQTINTATADFIERRQTKLYDAREQFNPYWRSTNDHLKWHQEELMKFYEFVDEQPRLNFEQEKTYGKAVKMWTQIENQREKLLENKILLMQNSTATSVPTDSAFNYQSSVRVTDLELAQKVGCSLVSLRKCARMADVSLDRLVNSNLKLVLSIVSRYRDTQVSNADLIQVGIMGLMKAAKKYDYAKGFRFATYATWYVHQHVADHLKMRKQMLRVPTKYIVLYRRMKAYMFQHDKEHPGRVPSMIDIANHLSCSLADVKKMMQMNRPVSNMYSSLKFSGEKQGRNSEISWMEKAMATLPNEHEPPALNENFANRDVNEYENKRLIEDVLRTTLTDAERDVIRMKYGLDTGKELTNRGIHQRTKLPSSLITQVEKSALQKLSMHRNAIMLSGGIGYSSSRDEMMSTPTSSIPHPTVVTVTTTATTTTSSSSASTTTKKAVVSRRKAATTPSSQSNNNKKRALTLQEV